MSEVNTVMENWTNNNETTSRESRMIITIPYSSMRCPRCNYPVVPEWNYCPRCGERLRHVEIDYPFTDIEPVWENILIRSIWSR